MKTNHKRGFVADRDVRPGHKGPVRDWKRFYKRALRNANHVAVDKVTNDPDLADEMIWPTVDDAANPRMFF